MAELDHKIINLLEKQKILIVSTFDENNNIHCAVKGIVGIEESGKIFIIDLYLGKTVKNLEKNSKITVTTIDEEHFKGYALQGTAKVVKRNEIASHIIESWENNIIDRISKRLVKSVQQGKQSKDHFEAKLPSQPEFLIEIDVENIIDLSPPAMRKLNG